MRKIFLHLRYNPNGDLPGKWSVWTSKGCLRSNLMSFQSADFWAKDYACSIGPEIEVIYGNEGN